MKIRTGIYAGYNSQGYRGFHLLEDDRELVITFVNLSYPGSFNDPPDSENGEYTYKIDGKEVERDELPAEVTDELIERIANDAEPDPSFEEDYYPDS